MTPEPDNNDATPDRRDLDDVDLQCRRCGEVLECYQDRCPQCGQKMEAQFCATYQPHGSRVARTIAYAVLAAGALMIVGLLIDVLSR